MTDEGPRRLTMKDVIDAQQRTIEQLTTRTSEPTVSVEFTRNAKGDTQISTKVSAPGGTDARALKELADTVFGEARELYASAQTSYPLPRTNGETK